MCKRERGDRERKREIMYMCVHERPLHGGHQCAEKYNKRNLGFDEKTSSVSFKPSFVTTLPSKYAATVPPPASVILTFGRALKPMIL